MELLAFGLQQVYQATLDRRAFKLYNEMSSLIADQIYDGRYFDPSTVAAKTAIDSLAQYATGRVSVVMYKENLYFQSLTDCPASIYNEADSPMEASDGLNPMSSQGYADILNVESIALAKAGQIKS